MPDRVREPKAAILEPGLAPYPNLEVTIFDNDVLCQPRHRSEGKARHLPQLGYEAFKLAGYRKDQK
jgi:hypothetical protein